MNLHEFYLAFEEFRDEIQQLCDDRTVDSREFSWLVDDSELLLSILEDLINRRQEW